MRGSNQTIAAIAAGAIAIAGWAYAFTLRGDIAELEVELASADDLREEQEAALAQAQGEAEELRATLVRAESESEQLRGADGARYEAEIAELQSKAQTLARKIAELEDSNERLREETIAQNVRKLRPVSEDPLESFRTISRVNLRSGPTTESEILVTLPVDAKVRVFEAVADGKWYRVGRIGYVHADFLQKADDAPR